MKIERLKRFNIWKVMCVLLFISVIVLVISLKTSKASYRVTASYPAAYGTIHFKSNDLEVVAVNIQNDSGEYVSSDTIPTTGYVLNKTESYCGLSNGDGTYTKDDNITITYVYGSGKVTVSDITTKGTKCFLYFDIQPTALKTLLANNTIDTSRKSGEFTSTFEEDTAGRIFEGPADDYGDTTYFFAGANPNNWVKFAGFYWRIIRVNGNGSIRLIYNGTDTSTTGTTTQLSSTSSFNSSYNNNMYVGYMYTSGSVHGLGTSSTIKGVLDTWYQNNIASYSDKIDTEVGFCGDRQPSTSSSSLNGSGGTGKTTTYYAPYIRMYTTHQFTYKCAESSDLYTVSSSSYGNKALSNPIGLITMDEVLFAGGLTYDSSYWLYTNSAYWTMTPSNFPGDYVGAFDVTTGGSLGCSIVGVSYGVRPVVDIEASARLPGSGTSSDPYIVS